MRRSWPWCLGVLVCLACPASDDGETDDGATPTSTDGGPTSSSDESTSDPNGDGDSDTADGDDDDDDDDDDGTGAPDNLCGTYCNAVVACGGDPATCAAQCEARLRFRDDHFGPDCRAATEASLSCIAGLTCDQMEAFACEDTEISEVTTCEGDTIPGPEVVAFCEAQVECDVPASVCELAILQDFVASAYGLGCEQEYAALLSCVAPLGCMATDPELDAACGSESDALDAACPGLFE